MGLLLSSRAWAGRTSWAAECLYATSILPTWAAHLNPCDSLGPSPRQARLVDGAQGREMSLGKCLQGANLWFSPSLRPLLFTSPVLLPEQVKLGDKVLNSATLCRGQV